MDGSAYFDFMKLALTCALWYLCSASDNIIGKVVLSTFPYPMTLTMVHLATASIVLGPIKTVLKVPRGRNVERRYFLTMLLPLALGKFMSSVSSFIGIWRVSVSYAHTVKATLPFFTVLLSRFVLKEKQTCPVYLSLMPIIFGVVIATATELSFDRIGLASSIFSTVCFSLQTIFTKKCLKETQYHHIELLVFITRVSTALFIPFWLLLDFRRIYYDQEFLSSGSVIHISMLLLCTSLLSVMHNIFAFTVLAMVSPLSYAVANATKRIFIIGGSLIILQNPVSPMNIVGIFIAIFGVFTYNKAKYDQNQAERRQEVLPYVRSVTNLNRLTTQIGVHHLPHSKSDANFMSNGHILGNGNTLHANDHLLFQNYEVSDKFQLIPSLDSKAKDSQEQGKRTKKMSSFDGENSDLHSRSVFHV